MVLVIYIINEILSLCPEERKRIVRDFDERASEAEEMVS